VAALEDLLSDKMVCLNGDGATRLEAQCAAVAMSEDFIGIKEKRRNTDEKESNNIVAKEQTSPKVEALECQMRVSASNSIKFDCDIEKSKLPNGEKEKKSSIEQDLGDLKIGKTKKRYLILSMFVTLHMTKSFQWICLSSVTNVVARFYRVDNLAINWTTILFMVTFLILAMPVSWLMEKIGLRRAVLIGTIGVTLGVIIKCFSCNHDGFFYCMLGHLIVGLAEPFFFSSYSQVASVWFPDDQVAMATAWSVNGEQMGLALGFIIPPIMIGSDPENDQAIQTGLFRLFVAVAIITTINTILIVLYFDEKPELAPGVARYRQMVEEAKRRRSSQAVLSDQVRKKIALATNAASGDEQQSTPKRHSIKCLGEQGKMGRAGRELRNSVSQQMELSKHIMLDKNFILLFVGFGLHIGTVYSIHTLLNQMITKAFMVDASLDASEKLPFSLDGRSSSSSSSPIAPAMVAGGGQWLVDDPSLVVGNTGLISIIAGFFGAAAVGYILDRYHRYKLTSGLIFVFSLVSMFALTASLRLANPLVLYLVAVPLGFAFTAYEGCAFDYAVEITYPNPELLCSTLLNISAQVFGIPISLVGSVIVDTYGAEALGLFYCAILALGLAINCFQGGQLKRQNAVREGKLNNGLSLTVGARPIESA